MAWLEAERDARHSDEVEVQLSSSHEPFDHGNRGAGDGHAPSSTHTTTSGGRQQRSDPSTPSSSPSSGMRASSSLSVLYSRVRLLLGELQGRSWLSTRWGAAIAAAARPLSTYGARLHLALFYVWGVYYQLPLRLLGVRFVSTARPLQQ